MRIITSLSIIVMFMLGFAQQTNAQNETVSKAGYQILKLKTSATCGDCESKIKKAVLNVKGVKDIESKATGKLVTIKYVPGKTNPKEIRKAIADAGFTTNLVNSSNKANRGHKCSGHKSNCAKKCN